MTTGLSEAEAMAEIEAIAQTKTQHAQVDAPEMPDGARSAYIPPQDEGAWVPAYQLLLDWKGQEYGRPVKLPKGQLPQLLQARWPDGRRAYTMIAPKYLEPVPTLPCIVVNSCSYKGFKRIDLVLHAEACHPVESRPYTTIFAEFMETVAQEDERARAIIDMFKEMPDAEPEARASGQPVPEFDDQPVKTILPVETAPGEVNLAIQRKDCPWPGCDWHYEGAAAYSSARLGKHVAQAHGG